MKKMSVLNLGIISALVELTSLLANVVFYSHYGLKPRKSANDYFSLKKKDNVDNSNKKNFCCVYVFADEKNKKNLARK